MFGLALELGRDDGAGGNAEYLKGDGIPDGESAGGACRSGWQGN
jgi:hypothetical protein